MYDKDVGHEKINKMVTSTNYYHEEANAEQHANYHEPQHSNDTNEEQQREEGDHVSKYFSILENQIPRNPAIEFLRQEATRLEYSAKRLRELANMLESRAIAPSSSSLNNSHAFYLNNGHVSSMQQQQQQQQQQRRQQQLVVDHDDEYLGCCSYEAAPLDENGIPKYKGKKRGRKPKKRVRRRNPNAKKRSHTAYTLFVQEMYPKLKQEYEELLQNQPPPQPQHQLNHDGQHHEKEEQLDDEMDGSVVVSTNPFQSKNIISMIAKQWQEKLPHEKEEWKRKASMLTEESEENQQQQQQQDDEHSVESEEEGKEDDSIAVATVAAAVAAVARHGGRRTSVEDVSRLEVASQEMNEKNQDGHNNEKEGRFGVP